MKNRRVPKRRRAEAKALALLHFRKRVKPKARVPRRDRRYGEVE